MSVRRAFLSPVFMAWRLVWRAARLISGPVCAAGRGLLRAAVGGMVRSLARGGGRGRRLSRTLSRVPAFFFGALGISVLRYLRRHLLVIIFCLGLIGLDIWLISNSAVFRGFNQGYAPEGGVAPVVQEIPGREMSDEAAPAPPEARKPTPPPQESPPDLESMGRPVAGEIIRGIGFARFAALGGYRYHRGVDFACAPGEPVRAVLEGVVASVENSRDYGVVVVVDHGAGWKTKYAHLDSAAVSGGDRVDKGEMLGTLGLPGTLEAGSEPCLHFELLDGEEARDPRPYLR